MNATITIERPQATIVIAHKLQTLCTTEGLPVIIAKALTPIAHELGELTVVHPTPTDPALVSSVYGTIAIWFKF